MRPSTGPSVTSWCTDSPKRPFCVADSHSLSSFASPTASLSALTKTSFRLHFNFGEPLSYTRTVDPLHETHRSLPFIVQARHLALSNTRKVFWLSRAMRSLAKKTTSGTSVQRRRHHCFAGQLVIIVTTLKFLMRLEMNILARRQVQIPVDIPVGIWSSSPER